MVALSVGISPTQNPPLAGISGRAAGARLEHQRLLSGHPAGGGAGRTVLCDRAPAGGPHARRGHGGGGETPRQTAGTDRDQPRATRRQSHLFGVREKRRLFGERRDRRNFQTASPFQNHHLDPPRPLLQLRRSLQDDTAPCA